MGSLGLLLLFLAHKFFALLQKVRLALNDSHGTVMQDMIQNSKGNSDIGKDLVLLEERFAGGNPAGPYFLGCHFPTHVL